MAARHSLTTVLPFLCISVVADLESLIFDRMHQLGHDKSLFLRWDTKSTGFVSEPQFRASIASLGISLNDNEIEALVAKYDSQGTGTVNYSDMWKYLQAAAEAPKSTAQSAFSTALLNRQPATGREYASLVRDIPESLEERIARGLRTMRESMYQKSSNFHALFVSLQNANKIVSIDQLLPALPKLGFPQGLVEESELRDVALRHSKKQPGFFTYAEFLSFCTGHDSDSTGAQQDSNHAGALDSPSLMNCLVKVNNINLRKFFKDLDTDLDGLITIGELARGLIEAGGLHESVTRSPAFAEYVETFCVRKGGYLGYAEFIKFVGARIHGNNGPISGQPASGAHAPVKVAEESTPSQVLELIVKTLRTSQVSVESMFSQFDSDLDGKLSEEEFFQGVSALGFTISAATSKAFFEAIDGNKNGFVEIAEFTALIVNPNKNPKLSTRVRHAPGGASSVPMGSFASTEMDAPARPHTARGTAKPPQTFDLSTTQTPLTAEEEKLRLERARPGILRTGLGDSKIDLSYHENQAQPLTPLTPNSGVTPGSETARARNPPGGRSTISFTNDHGALPTPVKTGPHANQESDTHLLEFDPAHPIQAIKQRPVNTTGASSIELRDDQTAPVTPSRSLTRPLHSPGGDSSISFNQNDSEVPRASKRTIVAPGGVNNISLGFEPVALSPEPVAPHYRHQDEVSIDLKFDPNLDDQDHHRRMRKAVQAAPASASNLLEHHSHRVESDLDGPNGLSQKTRKAFDGANSSVALGNAHGSDLIASYKEPQAEVDAQLIAELSKAIYANSQRLRHSFQSFNKNSQSATLSKANFVEGARSLKVNLSDEQADALFARFDGDGDGQISYSEFVRLLASK